MFIQKGISYVFFYVYAKNNESLKKGLNTKLLYFKGNLELFSISPQIS